MTTDFFDDFWAASELSALTRAAFGERMAAFEDRPVAVDPWSRPAAPVPASATPRAARMSRPN